MQHPSGFHFEAQRKIVVLRDVEHLKWGEIAKRVKTLAGKRPRPRHCANYYQKFNPNKGRVVSNYRKCGPRGPRKVTREVECFLIKQLSKHIPPRSPDLNPVERFWGWLKFTLRRMDLKDAMAKKAALGKMAYKERVRAVCRSKKAQTVASNHARSLRKVCSAVVKKKGAASGY